MNALMNALTNTPFFKAMSQNGLLLGLLATITIGLCVLTFEKNKTRIEDNIQHALKKALFELIPLTHHNNDMLADTQIIQNPLLGHNEPVTIYFAYQDNRPQGMVIPIAAPEGYGGTIRLVLGIWYNGNIAGVRVVSPHPETPGLGDAIELSKSDWILSFNNKSLQNPQPERWKVKKDGGDFDSFTGATITPRAVVKAVYQGLEFYQNEGKSLFSSSHSLHQTH